MASESIATTKSKSSWYLNKACREYGTREENFHFKSIQKKTFSKSRYLFSFCDNIIHLRDFAIQLERDAHQRLHGTCSSKSSVI
jgi:hypothetical protein